MTFAAKVLLDPARTLGSIDDRIYGQFIEHIGRAIYGGVFEPGSELADDDGYRLDVLDACRELRPSLLRWPGGNFASGYHWRDGIGPVEQRPLRRDLAWGALEPNTFGTEEFLELCRRLDTPAYLNLNLSTGTVDEALSWVEYCNATDALPEALLRQHGPHPEPHGVRMWGLGNENYGWWQHGHTDATTYGQTAREWAKLLRWADPSIELVAVGAPDHDWNWTVLREVGRFADYLSIHCYWHGRGDDPYHAVLAGPMASEQDIIAVGGMALAAARDLGLPRPLRIAVDEWGVWSRTGLGLGAGPPDLNSLMRMGLSARSGIDTRFEEAYDLTDALAVATWLHVLWRHPDTVGMATQAQMVNVIAPIHAHSQGVVRHTVFHPLATARAHAGGVALDVHVSTDSRVPAPGLPTAEQPAIDAAGTVDPDSGRLHLSLVNRSRDEEAEVTLQGVAGEVRLIRLWHDDPAAGNSRDNPDRVVPEENKVVIEAPLVLPPHSHVTVVTAPR